jgi:hypothetical protein
MQLIIDEKYRVQLNNDSMLDLSPMSVMHLSRIRLTNPDIVSLVHLKGAISDGSFTYDKLRRPLLPGSQ